MREWHRYREKVNLTNSPGFYGMKSSSVSSGWQSYQMYEILHFSLQVADDNGARFVALPFDWNVVKFFVRPKSPCGLWNVVCVCMCVCATFTTEPIYFSRTKTTKISLHIHKIDYIRPDDDESHPKRFTEIFLRQMLVMWKCRVTHFVKWIRQTIRIMSQWRLTEENLFSLRNTAYLCIYVVMSVCILYVWMLRCTRVEVYI